MADVLNLPIETSETAPNMIDAAIAVTAGKMHLASPDHALDALHRDDPIAVSYFRYELARQTAAALLRSDDLVAGVYEEQEVPAGEELAPSPAGLFAPLRLYVLVDYETAALRALIDALDHALCKALCKRFQRSIPSLLDLQIVDRSQAELLRPRAYGFRPSPALVMSRDSLQPDTPCAGSRDLRL